MNFNSLVRYVTAFAKNGTRTAIPYVGDTGRASRDSGFPPETEGFGAQPPLRTDMNGALHDMDAGIIAYFFGKIFRFDSGLSTAGGGYPRGALVTSDNDRCLWLSLHDDNGTNPNTPGQVDWVNIGCQQRGIGNANQAVSSFEGETGTWTNTSTEPAFFEIGATHISSAEWSTNVNGQLFQPQTGVDFYQIITASGIVKAGDTLYWNFNIHPVNPNEGFVKASIMHNPLP